MRGVRRSHQNPILQVETYVGLVNKKMAYENRRQGHPLFGRAATAAPAAQNGGCEC